ncbi:trichohyalin [Biomphalaria glabrata]|nr:trichohyalin-like [Biomphalaria glabrata]KAI8761713.1 trichohyalin [Biomphalaria glabrata]
MPTHWTEHYYEDEDGNKCLDLHHYSESGAMRKVKSFLYHMKREYFRSDQSRAHRFVDIITGVGKHSWRHYSVIKEDVEDFLDRKDYSYEWDHGGGRVTIDFYYST